MVKNRYFPCFYPKIRGCFNGARRVGVFGGLFGNSLSNPDPHRLNSDSFNKTLIFIKTLILDVFAHRTDTDFPFRQISASQPLKWKRIDQKCRFVTEVQLVVNGEGLNRAIVLKRCYP